MPIPNALPGRTVSQAGKHTSSKRRYIRVHNTKQYFIKKLKNVSCEYGRWVVEAQLCQLRDTSDTLIGRACAMFYDMLCNMMFVNYIYDMVVDTLFHKFHRRPFALVLYAFLMKDIGR